MKNWLWQWSPKKAGQRPQPLVLESLENRTLLSVAIGALGDSITAPYRGDVKGSGGDLSWVELLQTLRSSQDVTAYDVARDGATSTMLLEQGQPTRIANLAAHGKVDSALLFIGVNDVSTNIHGILAGNPVPFVQTLISHVTTALDTVSRAGPVHLVVANIPDTGLTPLLQGLLGPNPIYYQRLTGAITLANQWIQAIATARNIPVLDLFDLSYFTHTSQEIGGTQVARFLAPDGWHPGTVTQGLIANTFLAALNTAYGTDVSGLSLSDQEILKAAGIAHLPGETYLDVSRFVLFNNGKGSASSQGQESSSPQVVSVARVATADTHPSQFSWAGVGKLLDNAKPSFAGTGASAPVTDPGTGLATSALPMVAADATEVGQDVSSYASSALAGQPAVVSHDLLDPIFAEVDAAFFPTGEGV